MGGIFGAAKKGNCAYDLFFGTDYHSHLGTRRGGMAVYDHEEGFDRAIHNIENSPFRTKFERDVQEMKGQIGIGCISDSDPQPLIVRAHYGNFVLTTVCRINNADDIVERVLSKHRAHFMEMSSGKVNATELVASIIAARDNLLDGIKAAQEMVDGSLTMLIMTKDGIYASRDRLGRTPLIIGKRDDGYCASFESFAYQNLGYSDAYELGPNEIVYITADGYETVSPAGKEMKICAFLWTYYGYPTSTYEGVNVEAMRYRCGEALAKRDTDVPVDSVAGVPDSGIAHAIGYANESGIPFSRPLIKYTPTWPRSFMPPTQSMRHLIAKMKLISVDALIRDKRLLFIDDSIVRGTQMSDTASHLFNNGAREVHVRSACPPIMYGCKYLNFSRSTSEYDLITRRIIREREGDNDAEVVADYADQNSQNHKEMVDTICKRLKFTSLKYHELEDMIESIGIDPCKVCTYCWNGKE